MRDTSLRQLQKKVFDVFTKLESDRTIMLTKADRMRDGVDKLILMAKANGLSDGIIGLGSLIELIQKQTDEESKQHNSTEVGN